MLYTKAGFFRDFIRAYGYLGPAKYSFGQIADSAARYVDLCYKVYMNSARNDLGFLIVGRIVQKDGAARPINLDKMGNGLDDIERINFGITNSNGAGSVLSANEWTIPLNDCWLMGAIHAHIDCHLASPRNEFNILGTDRNFAATVTGRELLGLTTFGYTLARNRFRATGGEGYECTNPQLADAATFVSYQNAFRAASAADGFRALVATS